MSSGLPKIGHDGEPVNAPQLRARVLAEQAGKNGHDGPWLKIVEPLRHELECEHGILAVLCRFCQGKAS